MKTMIKKITIIGVGLIGGSFSLALRKNGYTGLEVVGVGRSLKNLQLAQSLGVIDKICNVDDAVKQADLVMLAVPMKAMGDILQQIAPHLSEHTIVTDAGSAKRSFVDLAYKHLKYLNRVVPGHPIAGTEESGAGAAFAELFERRKVILTPMPESDPDTVQVVQDLWEKTGAEVDLLDVGEHDQILALTSHLPHILAFNLVDGLSQHDARDKIFRYVAGGFRDFTRIASSNPEMWRDICETNRGAILDSVDFYLLQLEAFKKHLQSENYQVIFDSFTRSKIERESHVKKLK